MPKRIPTAEAARRHRAVRRSADATRSGSKDPWYKRRAWLTLRRWFLAQPGNALCAECRRRGFTTPAAVVDHIVPRQVDRTRELDQRNLQGLCRPCDNRKRARDVAAGLAGRGARPIADDGENLPKVRDLTGGGS